MEPCSRCGVTDPRRMIGLMSRWFAARAGLPLDGGYFYLCPRCYATRIEPHLDDILEVIHEHQRPDRGAHGAAPTPGEAAAATLGTALAGTASTSTERAPTAAPAPATPLPDGALSPPTPHARSENGSELPPEE